MTTPRTVIATMPELVRAKERSCIVPAYSSGDFPDFGPDDTAEEAASLKSDFKASFAVWHTNQWHCDYKKVIMWAEVADNVPDMRRKLDKKLAAAIPGLQAQLREAEAAAERLRTQHG